MEIHSHSAPSESHPFDLQAETLLLTLVPRKGDPTPGAYDSMPR